MRFLFFDWIDLFSTFLYCNRQNCLVQWNLGVPNCKGTWLARVVRMQCLQDFANRRVEVAADGMHRWCLCLFVYLLWCMKLVMFSFYYYDYYCRCRYHCYLVGNNDLNTFAIDPDPHQRSTYCSKIIYLNLCFKEVLITLKWNDIKNVSPWIVESLWITTRIIRFTAIVPCADFIAFDFTWIETSYEIFITRWTSPTWFSRHGVVTPGVFAFSSRLRHIKK